MALLLKKGLLKCVHGHDYLTNLQLPHMLNATTLFVAVLSRSSSPLST